ncbi:hypothetical protein BN946_scf184814.g2 [Trametes cinnabarina]|uniref:Reverse transcriptase domain-containing protein n=1 Tax=Pycnoporus cinnabarinus TaxID=5643 RepID=A0A060SV17_PYCCI|nr:hypothetical protein BN946_scf184814.g2 [Trametes cinnabarina]
MVRNPAVSGYGDVRQQVTKVDDDVRTAREIDSSDSIVDSRLLRAIENIWMERFTPSPPIRAEPYQINLYGPGHSDARGNAGRSWNLVFSGAYLAFMSNDNLNGTQADWGDNPTPIWQEHTPHPLEQPAQPVHNQNTAQAQQQGITSGPTEADVIRELLHTVSLLGQESAHTRAVLTQQTETLNLLQSQVRQTSLDSAELTRRVADQAATAFQSIQTAGATTTGSGSTRSGPLSLPRRLKDEPVAIRAVDDRPIADGLITHEVLTQLTLRSHSEHLALAIVSVPYPVILGLDWLERHNPSIDWVRRELELSCCGESLVVRAQEGDDLPQFSLASVASKATRTSITTGLGLGFNPRDSCPDPPLPLASRRCPDQAPSRSYLSEGILPWHAPRLESHIGYGRTGTATLSTHSVLLPRLSPIEGARLGSGRTECALPQLPGEAQTGLGQTEPEPETPPTTLNIKFVNSMRFRKVAYDPPPPEPPPDDPLHHIPDKYHAYADAFSPIEVEKLPPHRPGFDAAIELEDGASPPFGPLYHLSEAERAQVLDYVESNLRKGRASLCVDYRGLNAITKKNRYPLPLVNDLLDRVQGCTVFTTLDLKNAFNLIRIREGDEWKTVFRTHLGLFEYLVMPFGLTNAPGTFQAYIQDVLRDLLDVVCVVYIDDILIFSRTQAEHDQHVTMVLDRLRKAGLFTNAKKCSFDQPEVEYVGYLINRDGIRMDPKKLNTVIDWPTPSSVKEVQSFLGFTNFYRRFVKDYARIALPLTQLTKKSVKGAPFKWSPEADSAFEALRDAILSAPVLHHFDSSRPSTLSTDASDFAIAGILHQPDDDGLLHPVAFFSRKLTPSEINYEVYDKELLAIVESFRTFRAWLIGTDVPVSVVSDHKNLEYFMSSRVLTRCQARWSMFLSEFNFRLDYAPGIKNPADAPSRRADFAPREGDDVLSENHKALLTPVHTERIFNSTRRDASSAASLRISALTTISLDRADFTERLKAALRSVPEWRDAVRRSDPDFEVRDTLVYHRNHLFIPRPLRAEILFSR